MPGSTRRVFRFGAFELFTAPAVLSRNGELVSITPKALATLTALVLNQGKPLSKDELLTTVWPGIAVEEANLSQNIYTLRKLLAPDFPGQTIIENIPRLGYRFTLPVEEEELSGAAAVGSALSKVVSSQPEPTVSDVEPPLANDAVKPKPVDEPREEKAGRSSRVPLWGTVVAVTLCFTMLLFWQWPLLAAWLHRQPPLEWTRITSNSDEDRVTAVSLAPDGNLVAYADADGVILRGLQDAATHLLPSPKMRVVDELSWFPDRVHLILSGEDEETGKQQLWKVSVLGEAPVLLRSDARLGKVSHEGNDIAFLTPDSSAVWVMGAAGDNARQIAASGGGRYFSVLLWDAHDKGLILERRPTIPQGLEVDAHENALTYSEGSAYERVDLSDGKKTAESAGVSMGDACLVDGDQLIYSISTPTEGRESTNLWRVRLDEVSGAILSKPENVYLSSDYNHIYGFDCSGDGKRIAVVRKQGATSVYVGDFNGETHHIDGVRKLSMASNVTKPHAWSADSNSVFYAASGLDEHWKIYAQSLTRHDPDLVVAMGGMYSLPTFTPDHQWMLFKHEDVLYGASTLYRMAMLDHKPSAVPGNVDLTDFRCPLAHGTCVVETHSGKRETDFSVLDPVTGKGKLLAAVSIDAGSIGDWDVSPDGRQLVMTTDSDEPLHTVSLSNAQMKDIPFHPGHNTSTVTWSADGKGFFVASDAGSLTDVSFVDLGGKATLLRTTAINTWVVPSPDGKRVAFVDRSLDSNVWLLQQK